MNLPSEVITAIRTVEKASLEFGGEVVIVGAVAYGLWIDDPWRATGDVDLTVAINLDQYAELSRRLLAHGWRRHAKMEHRWFTEGEVIVDIIPAGPDLRAAGKIEWPESDAVMSLVGFAHVFENALSMKVGDDERIKVVPLHVYMLLKLAAYQDRPGAGKDIRDIASLLDRYEAESERRFSDLIFETGLSFHEAGAYLLGRDVGTLCTPVEAEVVGAFLDSALDEGSQPFQELVRQAPPVQGDNRGAVVSAQLRAFSRGFRETVAAPLQGGPVER